MLQTFSPQAGYREYRAISSCTRIGTDSQTPTVAGFVEWVLTYLLVAKDGIVYKDDLRKVYDGSIFFEIAGKKDGHY